MIATSHCAMSVTQVAPLVPYQHFASRLCIALRVPKSPHDVNTMSSSQAGDKSGKSLVGFIKSLAGFNGDLSSMTAPSWILSGTSLTEYSA